MMNKKSNIYNLVLITIGFIISIVLYSRLPNSMPIHWNINGQIDGYGPKIFAAFFAPVIMAASWIGMTFLPKIDPKKDNYKKFSSSYDIMICFMVTFFFVLHIVTIIASLGYTVPVDKIIMLMVGILFIGIGNYLPKSKSNYFYGIKTPWTLSSEESWKKTHRLGGKLFVLAGLIIMVSSVLFKGTALFIVLMASISIAGFVPIVASYFYAKNN